MFTQSSKIKLLAIFVLWVAVLLWLSYIPESESMMDVSVINSYDTWKTGEVTKIEVRVKNRGGNAVEPVFSVIGSDINNYNWDSDIEKLEPGEERVVNLTADEDFKHLPIERNFRVRVNAREDHRYKDTSPAFKPRNCIPRVKNPYFKKWPYSSYEGYWRAWGETSILSRADEGIDIRVGRPYLTWALTQDVRGPLNNLTVEFSSDTKPAIIEDNSLEAGAGPVVRTLDGEYLLIVYSGSERELIRYTHPKIHVLSLEKRKASIDISKYLEKAGMVDYNRYRLHIGGISETDSGYNATVLRIESSKC